MESGTEVQVEVPFPTLLNAAHRTYVAAMQAALSVAGFDDMPRTGYRIAAALAREAASLQDLADRLAVSKQATSRLVEVLVQRGYCERAPDVADRRKTQLVLTARGRDAAAEIRGVVARLNRDLAARVDADDIAAARATLATVVDMGRASGEVFPQ
jgi:DNA-binding MarR family transcriptional regulator